MSLYNMVNKVDPATFFILPLLGKHPDEYPRFRDCFLTARQFKIVNDLPMMVVVDEKEVPSNIYVLLRVGGGNREEYETDILRLQAHPNYISDEDDSFDNTYALFMFSCPDEWKSDYEKACMGDYVNTSDKYKERLIEVYPKMKEVFKQVIY